MNRLRRARGDEGTAAFEGAIIFPVLFLMFLSIFEFGLIFRDYLTAGDATADAVKFATIQGNKPTSSGASADFTAISLMRQDLANIPVKTIDRIVVFEAGPPEQGSPLQQVPDTCKTAAASVNSANCNIYFPLQAFYQVQQGNADYFKCVNPGDTACAWDPLDKTQRRDGPHVADISYLGIYIKIQHPYVSKLYGNTFTLEQASVGRLEPGQLTA